MCIYLFEYICGSLLHFASLLLAETPGGIFGSGTTFFLSLLSIVAYR